MDKITSIKQHSQIIWQYLASQTGNKFTTGSQNVKAWFRTDKKPSVHFYTNKQTGEVFYRDFAGDTLDCIKAWSLIFNITNGEAIRAISNFLGLDSGNFVPMATAYIPPPPEKPKEIITLDRSEFDTSTHTKHLQNNVLYLWLVSIFGNEQATTAAKMYHLGTAKNGAAAFWHVDINNLVRYCSLIPYNPDGHRRKDTTGNEVDQPKPHKGKRLTKCYFGEHLLVTDTAKPVCIVESEKTAIVSSIVFPQFIWIASGGGAGVTAAKSDCLQNRVVLLVPDFDGQGRDGYTKAKERLLAIGININLVDLFPSRNDKGDLCDHIVEKYAQTAQTAVLNNVEPNPIPTPHATQYSPIFEAFLSRHDFEVYATTQHPTEPPAPARPSNWAAELSELKVFFERAELPETAIKLPFGLITDVALFVDRHLSFCEQNNGTPKYQVYLDRLITLKNYLTDSL